jgi:hypothetical protein
MRARGAFLRDFAMHAKLVLGRLPELAKIKRSIDDPELIFTCTVKENVDIAWILGQIEALWVDQIAFDIETHQVDPINAVLTFSTSASGREIAGRIRIHQVPEPKRKSDVLN